MQVLFCNSTGAICLSLHLLSFAEAIHRNWVCMVYTFSAYFYSERKKIITVYQTVIKLCEIVCLDLQ